MPSVHVHVRFHVHVYVYSRRQCTRISSCPCQCPCPRPLLFPCELSGNETSRRHFQNTSSCSTPLAVSLLSFPFFSAQARLSAQQCSLWTVNYQLTNVAKFVRFPDNMLYINSLKSAKNARCSKNNGSHSTPWPVSQLSDPFPPLECTKCPAQWL
jgi:hypothetical protein